MQLVTAGACVRCRSRPDSNYCEGLPLCEDLTSENRGKSLTKRQLHTLSGPDAMYGTVTRCGGQGLRGVCREPTANRPRPGREPTAAGRHTGTKRAPAAGSGLMRSWRSGFPDADARINPPAAKTTRRHRPDGYHTGRKLPLSTPEPAVRFLRGPALVRAFSWVTAAIVAVPGLAGRAGTDPGAARRQLRASGRRR